MARWCCGTISAGGLLFFVKDAIIDPAIGRDVLALGTVRRPGLLRQVFGAATGCPAQIVSLQKLEGQLHDKGSLETVAHYLTIWRAKVDVTSYLQDTPKLRRPGQLAEKSANHPRKTFATDGLGQRDLENRTSGLRIGTQ